MRTDFTALEYLADGTFAPADYRFEGSSDRGWKIQRNQQPHLTLGAGYRLLRTEQCGICSTDLARQYLPFPLPQITGHEVIASDEAGDRFAVEINASHRARGIEECALCRMGLDTHCPDRLVLGIHDLPGGFGSYLLAPIHAAIPLPPEIPAGTGVLIEPLAAAFHAVETIEPQNADKIAVLGPRKLGMLIVAALAAYRRQRSLSFTIVAYARRRDLLQLSAELGADETVRVDGEGETLSGPHADVVIDATGNPAGLDLAIRLARREIHLKSTHGRPAAGLERLTALVVDELQLAPFPDAETADVDGCVAWLAAGEPPAWLKSRASRLVIGRTAAELLRELENDRHMALPRADAAVVDSAAEVDDVIRPLRDREVSLVRPRGEIFVKRSQSGAGTHSTLIDAITTRKLKLTSSRCGSFRTAIRYLQQDSVLARQCDRLITHRFGPRDLERAFRMAASPECIKAVIEHGDS